MVAETAMDDRRCNGASFFPGSLSPVGHRDEDRGVIWLQPAESADEVTKLLHALLIHGAGTVEVDQAHQESRRGGLVQLVRHLGNNFHGLVRAFRIANQHAGFHERLRGRLSSVSHVAEPRYLGMVRFRNAFESHLFVSTDFLARARLLRGLA